MGRLGILRDENRLLEAATKKMVSNARGWSQLGVFVPNTPLKTKDWLAGKSTINEDVSPIKENEDFPLSCWFSRE